MSVDDHGLEVLKKAGEEYPPGQKAEYRHRVRVTNDPSEAIPVIITDEEPGLPIYFDSADDAVTEPDQWVDLITTTVPDGIRRFLRHLVVSCRIEGVFQVTSAGERVLHGRTSAANPTIPIPWNPARPIEAGIELKVQFKARQGSPISDVGAHLMCSDFTILT